MWLSGPALAWHAGGPRFDPQQREKMEKKQKLWRNAMLPPNGLLRLVV